MMRTAALGSSDREHDDASAFSCSARARAGESVLVHGASGGVSIYTFKFAFTQAWSCGSHEIVLENSAPFKFSVLKIYSPRT